MPLNPISSRIGIIDLGTNTAHLLIAEKSKNELSILHKKRHYTFLAEDGINRISSEAINRLNLALSDFESLINKFRVLECHVVATEAFRKAENGKTIIDSITKGYKWNVEIITGDREAILIFKGISQIVNIQKGTYVVMDIGGGSVEFIISHQGKMTWKKSFPIGIANIFNKYMSHNSLTYRDLDIIQNDLYVVLRPLTEQIRIQKNATLIGAAGSFEILTKNLTKKDDLIYQEVSHQDFLTLMNEVLLLSEKERAKVTWIPKERIKYVTAAIILIKAALHITQSDKIIISPYAMKEGMAAEKLYL